MDGEGDGMGDSVMGGTKDGSVRSAMTSVDSDSSSNLKAMGYNVEVDQPEGETDDGRPIATYVLVLMLVAAVVVTVVSLL